MVATLAALTPVPTVGVPEARTGGQLVAQAPKHVLFGPESFLNRYTVRPCESTRMFPRLPLAAPTVAAGCPAGAGGRPAGRRPWPRRPVRPPAPSTWWSTRRRTRPARRRPARRPRPPWAE